MIPCFFIMILVELIQTQITIKWKYTPGTNSIYRKMEQEDFAKSRNKVLITEAISTENNVKFRFL